MYKRSYVFVVVILLTNLFCTSGQTKTAMHIQELYKKIGDGLISVRKEFPTSQSKIYPLLDQLDKLYNTSKSVHLKKQNYKKLFKAKEKEVKQLKSEITSTRSTLDATNKKFETEKSTFNSLLREKEDLVNKVKRAVALAQNAKPKAEKNSRPTDKFDDKLELETIEKLKESGVDIDQSLSLTSTSAPTSPR